MDLSKLPTPADLRQLRQDYADGRAPTWRCLGRAIALIDAMRPYLGHKASCHTMNCDSVSQWCDCGLDALLAHIQEPPK